MTDIAKAIAFAKECLRWESPFATDKNNGAIIIYEEAFQNRFDPDSANNVQKYLEEFLGNRFHIQITRGTSSLFKWSVIVGLQNRIAGPPKIFDHGRGDADDMWDAVFDACVATARLYPNA
jgi:hypothetical protein